MFGVLCVHLQQCDRCSTFQEEARRAALPQMNRGGIRRPLHEPSVAEEHEKKELDAVNNISGYITPSIRIVHFPRATLSEGESFCQTLTRTSDVTPSPASVRPAQQKRGWSHLFGNPAAKMIPGLLVGIALLLLILHFIDLPATIQVLRQNLVTPRGILLVLLSSLAFQFAYIVRGIRWKLFLSPMSRVGTFKVIQLFLVGNFINFLLPIQGGEVAKGLMLKRVARIPLSQSLPTIAMCKVLDLMPALVIMAIVPLFGLQMDSKLWFVLVLDAGILISIFFFVILAARKRSLTIGLLHKTAGLLPHAIGTKIEDIATNFIDSLLTCVAHPRIFFPALLLTCLAVLFDGCYAMFSFWTIGFPLSFQTAIFGYMVFSMLSVLPNPPGQVGSNEVIALLVFTGLLHLPPEKVTAMVLFYHPWSALLICATGAVCLSSLGLTISSALNVKRAESQIS